MMSIIGRSLQALSQVDNQTKNQLAVLPDNFSFEMKVLPNHAGFVVRKTPNNQLVYVGNHFEEKVDVSVAIKHTSLAFLIFTFRESTALAFAHDRTLINGDISVAMRMVRCLDRMEAIILPKVIARHALKQYPPKLYLGEKLVLAAKVYARLFMNLFKRGDKI